MESKKPIFTQEISPNKELEVDFHQYLPLGEINHKHLESVKYFHVDRWIALDNLNNFENCTARYIRLIAKKHDNITIYPGEGYVAFKDEAWRVPFNRRSGWTGGDGIFSFNIKNGRDTYDQQDAKTIFVFGDTLIGKSDASTHKRIPPLLMPPNTIAYLEGNGTAHKNIDFRINTNSHNNVIAFFEPQDALSYVGTVAHNLVNYTTNDDMCYLSGYNPDKVELLFDLQRNHPISLIEVFNYYPEVLHDKSVLNRGVKEVTIKVSHDGNKWLNLGRFELKKAEDPKKPDTIEVHKSCRYLKMTVTPEQGVGNHYPKEDLDEVIFGLNKVKFYTDTQVLMDISVEATSEWNRKKRHAWFWLQDGVVIDKKMYFLPLIITPDPNKPEGLQFAVEGVSLIQAEIRNEHVDFKHHKQKPTNLYRRSKGEESVFGAAIMNNSFESGYKNADGYVYIYGYTTVNGHRYLKVARVKPEMFELLDEWRFYSQGEWVHDLEKASPILEHISCEMSVSPIEAGRHRGKYLAVFQYNVDSKYVAYAIGDTPAGPFTDPRIVYECEEPVTLGRTAYTYNAKAHPHLSKPDDILVSYNVNSYDMNHHWDEVEVYHPRFIRLRDSGTIPIELRRGKYADE